MIEGIGAQLELWRNDAAVQAILIKSNSPKAFCAGGDIRYLYDSYKNGTADYKGYFSAESLYTTNFTEPLSYQDSAFLKLPKFP
ncbi:enoyl-CoA hydratase/isomerase family protein [Acinetobacter baumannii]|nr:enoyl-CoA hydratase/isomerase family protein [Acinetobacter baumannii]